MPYKLHALGSFKHHGDSAVAAFFWNYRGIVGMENTTLRRVFFFFFFLRSLAAQFVRGCGVCRGASVVQTALFSRLSETERPKKNVGAEIVG